VLREESPPATVGGGRVLQPVARRARRKDAQAVDRLEGLRSPDPTTRLASAIAAIGLEGWTERSLCRDSGVPLGEIGGLLERLKAAKSIVEVATGLRRRALLPATVVADLEDRVVRALARLHAASPRLSAIPRARVVSAFGYLGGDALVSGLIDRLKDGGEVVADERTVALRGYEPKLSQGERRLKAEIAEAYREGGLAPPDPSEWASLSGPKAAAVPELLNLLCEEERLVAIGPGLYLDFEVAAEIRRRVSERLGDGSAMSMADLRDLIGTTRKYAVPIGEYLDRIGLTRREGDLRRLRTAPAAAGTVIP
jgi:selenocysteine-specific elongation factor